MQREPFICSTWYAQPDIVSAVNLCMEALEKSGISADRATLVPDCLASAILCSNQIVLQDAAFKGAEIEVKEVNGGYDVIPKELPYIVSQRPL